MSRNTHIQQWQTGNIRIYNTREKFSVFALFLVRVWYRFNQLPPSWRNRPPLPMEASHHQHLPLQLPPHPRQCLQTKYIRLPALITYHTRPFRGIKGSCWRLGAKSDQQSLLLTKQPGAIIILCHTTNRDDTYNHHNRYWRQGRQTGKTSMGKLT